MKTKVNVLKACLGAAVFSAAIISGSTVLAQSDPEVSQSEEVNQAFERLDEMITAFEEDVRYVAPASDEEEELNLAMERLEIYADRIQNNLKYTVPDLEFEVGTTLANDEDTKKSDRSELLTDAKRISRNNR